MKRAKTAANAARAPRPLFRPTAAQFNGLLIAAFLSVGYALYLRYMVIEQSTVSLACEIGSADVAVSHAEDFSGAVPEWRIRNRGARSRRRQFDPAFDSASDRRIDRRRLRHRALQCRDVRARRRSPDPQPRASRAVDRVNASAANSPHSQTDCQFTKLSLNTT